LPVNVDLSDVAGAIAVDKDVDGSNPRSLTNWMSGGRGFAPATASAVIELLDQNGIGLKGSSVTVVGRSSVVGKPLLHLFLNRDATVTVAHSKTRDLAAATRGASIVVAAAGSPGLITAEHIGEGAVVIDVGTNFGPEGRLTGDVDTESVAGKAAAMSPVPGGIGAVTTALLFRNTVAGFTTSPRPFSKGGPQQTPRSNRAPAPVRP
ncbi:MAG: bifunctional 5,10-methylenetetrahydrofolate dehydrogenase/5,10-methenyltetrahydrofolate cyclohydrolase, partial [Micrococcaceae bacterium]|nr:bifunctional 5,10-methylenetetrahydrofolate dehydrogenase/5,10-methenyltetrahydrofolate cyclohydrolase [Micrococcaceae bacterium]